MNRLFVLQEEYAHDRHNEDGCAIEHLLWEYTGRNCDSYVLSEPDGSLPPSAQAGGKVIPIGSLEFVQSYLDKPMRPIEIPPCLQQFAGRQYTIRLGAGILADASFVSGVLQMTRPKIPADVEISLDASKWFLKDADHLKGWNSLLYDNGSLTRLIDPDTAYVVSERVHFLAEYRVFVYHNQVYSCQLYQGTPLCFPNPATIQTMVRAYSQAKHPDAYTLDIGIIQTDTGLQTVPIEVHSFAAVGLYGFYDEVLLDMWEAGFDWYAGAKEHKLPVFRMRDAY